MKRFILFSVMCFSAIMAQAQVITSKSINKIYVSMIEDNNNAFAYNGDYDDLGRMTSLTVYTKETDRKGRVYLTPAYRYLYEYDSNGLLTSRVNHVWQHNEWRCLGRHDYSLKDEVYTATYSRWNKKLSSFDAVAEKMDYTLLPDSSASYISYYHREHNRDSLYLTWQMPVINFAQQSDRLLTRK